MYINPETKKARSSLGPSMSKEQNPGAFHALEAKPDHFVLQQSVPEALRLDLGASETMEPPLSGSCHDPKK